MWILKYKTIETPKNVIIFEILFLRFNQLAVIFRK